MVTSEPNRLETLRDLQREPGYNPLPKDPKELFDAFDDLRAYGRALENGDVCKLPLIKLADKLESDTRELMVKIKANSDKDDKVARNAAEYKTYKKIVTARLHSNPELMSKHDGNGQKFGETVINILWVVLGILSVGINLAIKKGLTNSGFFALPTQKQAKLQSIEREIVDIAAPAA